MVKDRVSNGSLRIWDVFMTHDDECVRHVCEVRHGPMYNVGIAAQLRLPMTRGRLRYLAQLISKKDVDGKPEDK
jgi:hypothetical protein